MKFRLILLTLSFSTFGCVQHKSEHHHKEVLPPQNIEKSFQSDQRKSKSGIKIQKEALGKIFLLRAVMKGGSSTPAWEDMKPMIVMFERSEDELAMFERDTFAVYSVLDSNRLVTTFKIIEESEKDITFDWGNGLKIVPRAFYDDSVDEATDPAVDHAKGLSPYYETISSFVKSHEIKNNQLKIRQHLNVLAQSLKEKEKDPYSNDKEKNQEFLTQSRTLVVDYVLKPYVVNPRFQPKELDPLNRVGFFRTSVGIESLSSTKKHYAAHWDLSDEAGPIVFALSKNFPESTLQAVKEGILYWNLVLGKDKIRIIENVDPEADFPERTVVMHWLPWQDAGAAWANFQTDPLTGEILRGQIYMTSVFLQLSKVYPEDETPEVLGLRGMASGRTCLYPAQSLFLNPAIPEGKKSKYMMDQLRHVVAHEVGHTMGLRHNFAASMDSGLKAVEINEAKKKYETDPGHEGAPLSSSIMDYIRGLEEGLIGRWIQSKTLAYDVVALKWVYSPNGEVETDLSFCTDEDISKAYKGKQTLYGCERFDAPANPLNIRPEENQRILKSLVQMKFDSILSELYPANSTEVRNLKTVLQADYKRTYAMLTMIGQQSVSSTALSAFDVIFTKTGDENATSAVHFKNQVGNSWDSNYLMLEELLKTQLTEIGGLAPALKGMLPLTATGDFDIQFMANQLKNLKNSGRLAKGKTVEGRDYQLNESQQAEIEKYLQKGIASYDSSVFSTITQLKPYKDKEETINGKTQKTSKTVRYGIGQSEWFPEVQKLLSNLILSQKEIKTEKLNEKEISYGVSSAGSQRKELATMMAPGLWSAYSVSSEVMNKTKAQLFNRLKTLYAQLELGADLVAPTADTATEHENFISKLKGQNKIPSVLQTYIQEDIDVLKALETAN